jgi:hypothetical protein
VKGQETNQRLETLRDHACHGLLYLNVANHWRQVSSQQSQQLQPHNLKTVWTEELWSNRIILVHVLTSVLVVFPPYSLTTLNLVTVVTRVQISVVLNQWYQRERDDILIILYHLMKHGSVTFVSKLLTTCSWQGSVLSPVRITPYIPAKKL